MLSGAWELWAINDVWGECHLIKFSHHDRHGLDIGFTDFNNEAEKPAGNVWDILLPITIESWCEIVCEHAVPYTQIQEVWLVFDIENTVSMGEALCRNLLIGQWCLNPQGYH